MARIQYQKKRFTPRSKAIIKVANAIIAEYRKDNFDLTLRQLYYQFVSRDVLPNTLQSYKNLGSIINDGRLAGEIDWEAIVDRTRELRGLSHWNSPGEIVQAAANSYHIDRWKGQKTRPEVWIEKDALAGVFERVCNQYDVSYFSCRGYTSQSEMWEAGERIRKRYEIDNQKTVILHFGDHDPSGIDMSRDIETRLNMFLYGEYGSDGSQDIQECLEVKRIALHMSQVKAAKLPPNPAKITDSRARMYIAEHGRESWELDALDVKVLAGLVKKHVEDIINDEDAWEDSQNEEAEGKAKIKKVAEKI